MKVDLDKLLETVVETRGSDLHIAVGRPPVVRLHGRLRSLNLPNLTPEDTIELVRSFAPRENLDEMEQVGTSDFAIAFRDKARFRCSIFKERGYYGAALRLIPNQLLNLKAIGLPDAVLNLLLRPRGLILVTGPTGSGKTTTLYAALSSADSETYKIITTEDPVEYQLPNIVQVQVNEEIGVGYGACLRTILRQDPDMILVGEIRDRDTAQIAVEASLTGHVVFSTLHTNDAASAVVRLVDIGIEPFLLSATLEAVIGQRLVRTICSKCKTSYLPPKEVVDELALDAQQLAGAKFFYGKGCDNCYGTGYRGRMALYEILVATERIKEAIIQKVSVDKLAEIARAEGMRTLRDSGLLAIFDGRTTPEEVVRETVFTS